MIRTIRTNKRRTKPNRVFEAYNSIPPQIVVSENKAIIRVLASDNSEQPRICAASSILPNRKQRRTFFPQLNAERRIINDFKKKQPID